MNYDWKKWLATGATILLLLWLWPNLVHEPLHVLALRLQGADGYVTQDWGFPAHPSTTRTSPLASLSGGFLFLLLPSLISVILLIGLWFVKESPWFMGLEIYLTLDLIVNVIKYTMPFSDFRFFSVMTFGQSAAWILAILVLIQCALRIERWTNLTVTNEMNRGGKNG